MNSIKPDNLMNTSAQGQVVFCRKCGRKLSIDDPTRCVFCGTIVDYKPFPEANEKPHFKEKISSNKRINKKILLFALFSVLIVGGLSIFPFLKKNLNPIPVSEKDTILSQDINTINGSPEFYNVEFRMTVDQASSLIKMKHKPVKGLENSPLYKPTEALKKSHILFEDGEVFSLYGIEAASVYVSFHEKYVDGIILSFNKQVVSYSEITNLYTKIYGTATTISTSSFSWIGPNTTIEIYDTEDSLYNGDGPIIVKYSISKNSQYGALSFEGSELDPCDFLGKNNVFSKDASYYIAGLQETFDYTYETISEGDISFEKYILYPKFEYMGIGEGHTAISFDQGTKENTIDIASYLFPLDNINAIERIDYIKNSLTEEYGLYHSCAGITTRYEILTFDGLKQKVANATPGVYNLQWKYNGKKITFNINISADKSYYECSISYAN